MGEKTKALFGDQDEVVLDADAIKRIEAAAASVEGSGAPLWVAPLLKQWHERLEKAKAAADGTLAATTVPDDYKSGIADAYHQAIGELTKAAKAG